MSITLNLKPEIENGLVERARSRGLSIDAYLEYLLQNTHQMSSPTPLTGEERAKAIIEWAKSHRYTEPLSDEAISRESIYADRD